MSGREAEFGKRMCELITEATNLISEAIKLGKEMAAANEAEAQRRDVEAEDIEATVTASMAGMDDELMHLLGGGQ